MAALNSEIILKASELTKRYGELQAVDHLSFEVRRGEILGFLGPNGSGKTTSIKMMCGLLKPDSGAIELNGLAMDAAHLRQASAVGLSPQDIVIWETLTCFEQLVFIGQMYDLSERKAKARAAELLAALGLNEKRNKLGRTLSGGLQRRLNIALGLVHEPEILFLDEPQAGLDPQSRVLVREYISSQKGKMTVVLTTHDMEEAEKLADRVLIIDRGKLLISGIVGEIKEQIGITPIKQRETTLEDVFIQLTGRGLRE